MHGGSRPGQVRMFQSAGAYSGHVESESAGHEARRIPGVPRAFMRAYSGREEKSLGSARKHIFPLNGALTREFIPAGTLLPLKNERNRI